MGGLWARCIQLTGVLYLDHRLWEFLSERAIFAIECTATVLSFFGKLGQSGKNSTPSCVNQSVVHLARVLSLLTPDSRQLGSPSVG